MVNYQLGKIYKIVCNETGEQYIGATCQKKLCTRLAQHVSSKKCASKGIIERGNYEILLIESVPVDSKDQLHQRERFYIESIECVNKQIPCRTETEKRNIKKEWRQENKEYQKEWRQDNKEKMKEYNKKNYVDNREKILEKQKKYDIKHRDNKLEYDKEYRQQNRKIINQKRREKYHAEKLTQEEHREERREYWANLKEIKNESLSPT